MVSNGERLPLKDKVVLVTGAASGIGRSIAELFAQSGAYVLVNDVVESGREVANSIGGAFLRADLADVEQVRSLATRALEARGRVDILVNNAGYQHVAPVEEFPEEQWIKLVQVMLTAPFQLTRRLLPGMKGRGWGRIINIASIHGLVASPYKSAYVSAKHGLIGLTKAVALEAGAYGVTVNAICPSYVRTPLVEGQVKEQARALDISED
ncbi:MAG: SDR family NAD(P)-dependent oxidoreductase, partial [Chloroflexota bacterium]|nr:SDR family NAD(P)-dependent oxidoreductase [Chloroflexota bacterium]